MSKRRTHSPEFMARVAIEAISVPGVNYIGGRVPNRRRSISGRKTIQEIAADHAIGVAPSSAPCGATQSR